MNKAGWIVALVLFIVCVHLYTKQQGPATPKVVTGVTVRIDTVIKHDTIQTTKRGSDFAVRVIPAPPIAVDTIKKDSVGNLRKDSMVCYSDSQTYASGASVHAEMCSRFFPKIKPLDLTGSITFHPGNDSMKIFSRVDTIPKIIYKPPIIPTWQAVTLGVVGGVLFGWLALK